MENYRLIFMFYQLWHKNMLLTIFNDVSSSYPSLLLRQPRVIYNDCAAKQCFSSFFFITNLAIQTFCCILVMMRTRGENNSDPSACLSLLWACFSQQIILSITSLALNEKEIRQVCFVGGMWI